MVNYKFSVKYSVIVFSKFRNGGVRHRVRRSNLMETKSWSWEAHVMSHYNTFKPPTYSHLSIIRLSIQFSSVQSLSHVWLFVTPWTTACQAPLSFIVSLSFLKLTSIELMMPSNHLILFHSLLLLPSIFPSIRVFSNECWVDHIFFLFVCWWICFMEKHIIKMKAFRSKHLW